MKQMGIGIALALVGAVVWAGNRPSTPIAGTLPVEWRCIGPGGGGAFKSITASRWQKNRIYAGSDVGGFYVSEDRGRSWRMSNFGLDDPYVACIVEHPTEPSTVFIGVRGGIYVSRDLGKTWKPLRKGLPPRSSGEYSVSMNKLVFAPNDPKVIYAISGRPSKRSPNKGLVYVSRDGGESWQSWMADGVLPQNLEILDFTIDSRDPKRMLLATEAGLYATQDGGATWKPSNTGLPTHLRTLRLARAPSQPNVVYVTLKQKGGETPWSAGVYRSDDGGATWSARCNGLRQASGWAGNGDQHCTWTRSIVVDENDAETVYAGGACWSETGVYKSTDGGRNWKKTTANYLGGWIDFWGPAVDCFTISPIDPKFLAFGTGGGVYATEDGATTWSQRYAEQLPDGRFAGTGLEDTCVHKIVADPTRPGRFYVGYFDVALLITEDYGKTFRRCIKGIPGKYDNSCFSIVQAADDPKRLWAAFGGWASCVGAVAESRDGGLSWKLVTGDGTSYPGYDARSIACFGEKPNYRLVHLCKDGVVSSDDGGGNWDLAQGLFDREQPGKLMTRDGETLYCATEKNERGSVWRSLDRGKSWQRISDPKQAMGRVWDIAAKGDEIVVVTRQTRAGEGGAWCSTDGGKSWRLAAKDHFFAAALITGGYMIAAMTDHPYHDDAFGGGLIASKDGGKTWMSLNTPSLHNRCVTQLCADPFDPLTIWAGTGGNSVFVGKLK